MIDVNLKVRHKDVVGSTSSGNKTRAKKSDSGPGGNKIGVLVGDTVRNNMELLAAVQKTAQRKLTL